MGKDFKFKGKEVARSEENDRSLHLELVNKLKRRGERRVAWRPAGRQCGAWWPRGDHLCAEGDLRNGEERRETVDTAEDTSSQSLLTGEEDLLFTDSLILRA